MVSKDVFGAVKGEEGKTYFVVETLENGHRRCVTSKLRAPAPDPTACCAGHDAGRNSSHCGLKASYHKTIERDVRTSTSRYAITVYEFEIDACGIMVGEEKPLTETVLIGYCGIHDPQKAAAREEKRNAKAKAERAEAEKHRNRDDEINNRLAAKQFNYNLVVGAAEKVLTASKGLPINPSLESALFVMALQIARLEEYIAAGSKSSYGFSPYMVNENGEVKDQYKAKGDK